MTKDAFEADLASCRHEVSIITPIGQLESYSCIFFPAAVECACARCAKLPEGKRQILTVMQLFVSVLGLPIATGFFPEATVIEIGTPPPITIQRPKYFVTPGVKCDPGPSVEREDFLTASLTVQ